MPWVDVADELAKPPRLPKLRSSPSSTAEEVEVIDGWGEIDAIELVGQVIDLTDAATVEITDSSLIRCRLVVHPEAQLRVRRSVFDSCDLSQLRFDSVIQSRITACKLTGTEFEGKLADVELAHCALSMTRFPGAQLSRVLMGDCSLAEAEFFETSLIDVAFDDSVLEAVNMDRARFERVDLRRAAQMELLNCRDFSGCVITSIQAQAMALQLAHNLGLGIENDHI